MKIVKAGGVNRNNQLTVGGGRRPTVVRVTDLATLIQRFYSLVERALNELESGDELGPREINAMVSLAKTLPLLEQAELARDTKVNEKSIKDLSNQELKKLAGRILKSRRKLDSVPALPTDSPCQSADTESNLRTDTEGLGAYPEEEDASEDAPNED